MLDLGSVVVLLSKIAILVQGNQYPNLALLVWLSHGFQVVEISESLEASLFFGLSRYDLKK